MTWFQRVRERRRAACDDPRSLGYRAGLAPEIPVVAAASHGSACSRLSTVRCGEPRTTGRTVGGQEMTVAVPGEKWNHFVGFNGLENAGAPPEMIYRHQGNG